ncbi:putative reverse transcriptase domain-containing protein [Tanacetum coccineum]
MGFADFLQVRYGQQNIDDTTRERRNIRSNNSKDGLDDLVNKLDNLERDMKKLKESVHAIQVGCPICDESHLDKDCPLNEEVKQVEEVVYGEFGRTTPFEKKNKESFHVGASINVMPRSIFEHLHLTNLKKTNMLCEMVDMYKKAPLGIVENVLVKIDKFLFPADFVILYNTPSETTILGRPFFTTIHVEIDVFAGKISLGINKDRISFDTMRKEYNYMNPSEKIFMVRPQSPG